ncbi:RNA polymerase sigma factor [Streptomyces coelicoflavus]|uniref:RNA polymerase sigma factor n=1 Tax=Streptomyces coelicoflavus TaxID=285562 RepID=UPI0030B88C8E
MKGITDPQEERVPLIPDRAEEPERRASRAASPRPEAAGFAVFYEANFDAVLGFVTRRTSCPHVAADLTAEIFVAALQAARQYDPRRGAPAARLYGSVRNILASTTAAASSNSTRSPG